MKKPLSLLLTAVMLCSMLAVFAVPALAETDPKTDEKYEIFENFDFGESGYGAKVETKNFILEAGYHSANAVEGGGCGEYVKICAKEKSGLIIDRIEARVSSYGDLYSKVRVTAGTMREKDGVENDSIVHVDNIKKAEFAFADGYDYVYFDMIKVYYDEESATAGSIFSGGTLWLIIGVAAAGVAAAVVIVVVKKKKKPDTADGAAVENSEE